jgi:hypothetical protein
MVYGSFLLRADHYRIDAEANAACPGSALDRFSNRIPESMPGSSPTARCSNARPWPPVVALLSPIESVFDPQGQVVTSREPLWQRFILAAIVCFLLDLLLRRVRLFDRQFPARPRRAIGTR